MVDPRARGSGPPASTPSRAPAGWAAAPMLARLGHPQRPCDLELASACVRGLELRLHVGPPSAADGGRVERRESERDQHLVCDV